MTGKRIIGLSLAALSFAFVADAVEYEAERYEVIVDRSPFGEDPLVVQEEQNKKREDAAAAAAARKMESQIRLCYLLEAENGEIRAGFHNKVAKSGDPKSIMLTVGENFQGMKLSAVDIENSSATLLLNGKPVTFELTKAAPPKAATKITPPTNVPRRQFGGGLSNRRRPEPQKEPEPQLSPEEAAARREEVRKRLQDYQVEVIRAGMPPLPIPLTQEMDDQLVSEGVLEPQEN